MRVIRLVELIDKEVIHHYTLPQKTFKINYPSNFHKQLRRNDLL